MIEAANISRIGDLGRAKLIKAERNIHELATALRNCAVAHPTKMQILMHIVNARLFCFMIDRFIQEAHEDDKDLIQKMLNVKIDSWLESRGGTNAIS